MDAHGANPSDRSSSDHAVLAASPDALVRRGLGLIVLLDAASDAGPVTLAGSGPRLWEAFAHGASIEDAARSVASGEVTASSIVDDVRRFADHLAHEGLLTPAYRDPG